jgi:hypothetical protein
MRSPIRGLLVASPASTILARVATLSLTVVDDDPAEVDRLSRALHAVLDALDLDRNELVADAGPPPLAKSGGDTVTALLIALATSPVLVQLGALLRDWVTRDRGRKVVVRDGDRSVELTGGTAAESAEVIRDFFHRELDRDPDSDPD